MINLAVLLIIPLSALISATVDEICYGGACYSHILITAYKNGMSVDGIEMELSYVDCFDSVTVAEVICARAQYDDECKVFSRVGTQITSFEDLVLNSDTSNSHSINVWLVEPNRLFIWPTFEIGHKIQVSHITIEKAGGSQTLPGPVILETLNESPRIFLIHNFFTTDEAEYLIERALSIADEEHRLKRSTTGAVGKNFDTFRTSENAFDTSSEVSLRLKRRGFELLGIRPYDETFADGLQLLRYNRSAAYMSHLDWIEGNGDPRVHNWDSAADGTNRFATILFYLNALPDGGGGETVFSKVRRGATGGVDGVDVGGAGVDMSKLQVEVDDDINRRNLTDIMPSGSWQRQMVLTCRSHLSVKPVRLTAVLFYSQHPSGLRDYDSYHGGCPVLEGEKWLANLWIWNGPRHGYWVRNEETGLMERPGQHRTGKFGDRDGDADGGAEEAMPVSVDFVLDASTASFLTKRKLAIGLYWVKQAPDDLVFMAKLVPNEPVSINSFRGHEWVMRATRRGATMTEAATVVLQATLDGRRYQEYRLTLADLESTQFPSA